jgi:hypothetical protein
MPMSTALINVPQSVFSVQKVKTLLDSDTLYSYPFLCKSAKTDQHSADKYFEDVFVRVHAFTAGTFHMSQAACRFGINATQDIQ